MPGLVKTLTLDATINFIVSKDKISEQDQHKFLSRYDVDDMPPKDTVTVPLYDLRNEWKNLGSAQEQLDDRG